MYLKLILAALILAAGSPVFPQAVPASTTGRGLPLKVGVGFSDFSTEFFTNNRMQAPTAWADWSFYRGPSFLHGFGLELEFRDLNFGQPARGPNYRQLTAGGGPIYTWWRRSKFHPYGKFLVDYGAMDHIVSPHLPPTYTADKWLIYAPGGGVEYRALRNIWVRADYEYQFWGVEWFHGHYLNPQGFTIGASYDFGHVRRRF
jgi:opacity protein-like surface antigen